jgi:hypothetical protein
MGFGDGGEDAGGLVDRSDLLSLAREAEAGDSAEPY